MKHMRIHCSLLVSLAVLAAVLAFPEISCAAGTQYVDDDYGNAAPGSGAPSDPFHTIQAAVNAAGRGDTIRVAAGLYVENIVITKSELTLIGAGAGDDPAIHAIIDGNYLDHAVEIVEVSDVVLRGFTFRHGRAEPTYGGGGGVYIESANPIFTDCLIKDNGRDASGGAAAQYGGGAYASNASPIFDHCTFENNLAVEGGGGLGVNLDSDQEFVGVSANVTVIDCTFRNNGAGAGAYRGGGGLMFHFNKAMLGYSIENVGLVSGCLFEENMSPMGGGMYVNDQWDLKIVDSVFKNNQAAMPPELSAPDATGNGGGLCMIEAKAVVVDTVFSGNTAVDTTSLISSGGGVYNEHDDTFHDQYDEEPRFVGCTFRGNIASLHGGGLFNTTNASPIINNCVFVLNQAQKGGGIANRNTSIPDIRNTTITRNHATDIGGGMYAITDCNLMTIYNSIVWGNTNDNGSDTRQIALYENSEWTGSHSDIAWDVPWSPTSGMIDADPMFVNAAGGDVHLTADSPCRDAGDDTQIADDGADLDDDGNITEPTPFDYDGEARANGTVDMGADEFGVPANDGCTEPMDITTGVYSGNLSAGVPGGEALSCAYSTGEPALWYRFIAPADGQLWVSTCGSNDLPGADQGMDTVLSIHSACPATDDNTLACNDDWPSGGCPDGACADSDQGSLPRDSAVCLDVTEGNIYLIRVSRYVGSSGGRFVLNLGYNPPEVWVDDDWAGLSPGTDPDGTGHGGGPATSMGYDAFTTIQEGIDAVAEYGTVHVAAGFYHENIALKSNVTVSGAGAGDADDPIDPDEQSVMDGSGGGSVVSAVDIFGTLIQGFRIVNGSGTWVAAEGYFFGGGIYNENGGLTVRSCLLKDNAADYGGGMACRLTTGGYYTVPSVSETTFADNGALIHGGGMANLGIPAHVTACVFEGNGAGQLAKAVFNFSARPVFVNCLVNDTDPGETSLVYEQVAGGTWTHCTLWSATDLPAVLFTDNNTAATLTNCIFARGDNVDGDGFSSSPITDFGQPTQVAYSDIHSAAGAPSGTGNFSINPLFADPLNGDFHLRANSSCVDEGTNSAPSIPSTDLDGNPRISDGDQNGTAIADMGAYELKYGTLFVKPDATGVNDGSSWANAFTDLQSALDRARPGEAIWVARGTYKPSVLIDPGDPRSATFYIKDWMQIHGGFAGNEDPATFDPANRDFETNETILSGDIGVAGDNTDNAYHLVLCVGPHFPSSVHGNMFEMSGFTIRDANAENIATGAMELDIYGHALLASCKFTNNQANWGGGLTLISGNVNIEKCLFEYNQSVYTGGGLYISEWYGSSIDSITVDIVGCTFNLNSASSGGGIYAEGGAAGYSAVINIDDSEFTTNSADNDGGGIYLPMDGVLTLNDTHFAFNTAQRSGGAIYANDYGTIADSYNNVFHGNTANRGGAAYLNGETHFHQSVFKGNRAMEGGGAIWVFKTDQEYDSCIFSGNYAGTDGGAIVFDNSSITMTLRNCTLAGNFAENSGTAIFFPNGGYLRIFNSILWGNYSPTAQGFPLSFPGGGVFTISKSTMEYGQLFGALEMDPLFVAPVSAQQAPTVAGDYHVLPGSPCRDFGLDSEVVGNSDIDGETRIQGLYVDIGADEIQDTDEDGMPDYWEEAHGLDPTVDDTGGDKDGDGLTNLEELNNGTNPALTDTDGDGFSDLAELAVGTDPDDNSDHPAEKPHQVFIDDDWDGTALGADPDAGDPIDMQYGWNAFSKIQLGIDNVYAQGPMQEAGSIIVYAGTYMENITLRSHIHMFGKGRDTTVIDGGGSGVVVRADHVENGFMANFTITNGSDVNGGGFYINDSEVTVNHCRIVDNYAHYGAGIRNVRSTLEVPYCIFERNKTSYGGSGGAINNDGSTSLIYHCAFNGNTATNGGGIRNWGESCATDIWECTFVGNTAITGGGVSNVNGAEMNISNTTFADNRGTYGGGISNESAASLFIVNSIVRGAAGEAIYNDGSTSITAMYSDIQQPAGAYPGSGNINADPLLSAFPDPGPDSTWGTPDDDYGDLHLSGGSPCIDAGNNDHGVPAFDMDEQMRPIDDPATPDTGYGTPPIVDLGADEYAPTSTCAYDYNFDGDVDGSDLFEMINDSAGPDPEGFSMEFGSTDCQ